MKSPLLQAPSRYAPIPANADLVYDSICKVLSERGEQVTWEQFGANEWKLREDRGQRTEARDISH